MTLIKNQKANSKPQSFFRYTYRYNGNAPIFERVRNLLKKVIRKEESYVEVFDQNQGELVENMARIYKKNLPLAILRLAFEDEVYDIGTEIFLWLSKRKEYENFELLKYNGPKLLDAGYPWFSKLETETNSNNSDKLEKLALKNTEEMLSRYLESKGNDLIRTRLAEGICFGLAKYYGSKGLYSRGLDCVKNVLKYYPRSIHLKACEFAFQEKIASKPLDGRFHKFIGEDTGNLRDKICPLPFKRFDIGPNGDVLVCCGHWLPKTIGNIVRENPTDILNSSSARKIRSSMLDGSYKYCNHLECGSMNQGTLTKFSEVEDQVLRDAINSNNTIVNETETLLFAFDQTCNLACPSCRKEKIIEKPSQNEEKATAIANKIGPVLRNCKILNINPAGELFFSLPSRKILESINEKDHPDLHLDIISNGTLFSESEWSKFPNIHKKIRSVRISTDSCSRETFEKLRYLGKWDIFLRNVQFLGTLRKEGKIPQLKFSFTYQKDNFREMRDFIAFCKSLNADFAIFERLQNLGSFSNEEYIARAVHHQDHPLYNDFINEISDPVFEEGIVWSDFNYFGAKKISNENAKERLKKAIKA